MKTWEWPGVLAFEYPDSWTVIVVDGTIEVEPPQQTSATHISSYVRKESLPPTASEARDAVRTFVRGSVADGLDIEAETRGQDVVASATYEVDRDGMPLLVDVRVLIARHRMVVSSITCELAWPQDRARAVAIAESIRLVRAADAPT